MTEEYISNYLEKAFQLNAKDRKSFLAFFGVPAEVIDKVFKEAEEGICLADLFQFFFWAKTNSNIEICAGFFRTSRSTFIRHLNDTISKLSKTFSQEKIDGWWPSREEQKGLNNIPFTKTFIIVDCFDCISDKPTNKRKRDGLPDGKEKLKYEVSITITEGIPLRFSGPFTDSEYGIEKFKNGTKKLLSQDEKVFGDPAYVGESCCISPFKKPSPAEKKFPILVENVFDRLRSWKRISSIDRNHVEKHEELFRILLGITRIWIQLKPLKKNEQLEEELE